jgi:hypothetical protein
MSHYHYLGADADDEEGEDKPIEVQQFDDTSVPAALAGKDEVLDMINRALRTGERVTIPLFMMTQDARDYLADQGIIPKQLQYPPNAAVSTDPAAVEPFEDANVEEVVSTGNPKDAIGDTKVDLSLNPSAALIYMAAGFKDGARKYGPYNWRTNAVRARVYIAAAQRHIQQYLDGEDIDPISLVPHVGHALACLAIIADATATGNLIDDRPSPGAAGELIRRLTETKK